MMLRCRDLLSRLLPVIVLAAAGCSDDGDRLFGRLDAGRTGVDFENVIAADDSLMNPLDFFYVYNGGGVAVGDLNGDGLPDLYFAGNTVENRLYLNRGNFQFEDVTEAAGVGAAASWSTGIALVDINDDGLLDIYVCAGGPTAGTRGNRLYVNRGADADGVPVFKEQAARYGIADSSYSTHAGFFDYDRDGDLDLYVLNTAMVGAVMSRTHRSGEPAPRSMDRLYRNDGGGTFTDVSEEAGIRHEGYGLGLAISDVNKDGWPDVYAANDFISKDLLYVNNGDGTFTNRSAEYLKQQSYSAMGVDIADVDNDARVDIMVLDMLPKDAWRRRVTSNTRVFYEGELQVGRNTLQLNNGPDPEGRVVFSEIGQLAGVAATDWSWAPLLADFDNDGDRDLFVTTGYGEMVTHLDFERRSRQVAFSGTAEENRKAILEAMKELPHGILPNFYLTNEGDLTFTESGGMSSAVLSNGAAFADLDQDGDLDLVTNNINEKAFILKNLTHERSNTHALRIVLRGAPGNGMGLGARLTLRNAGTTQYHDHSVYRGYQSTVEPVIHFGLDADSTADSLEIVWPDGASQLLTDVRADEMLEVRYHEAVADRQLALTPEAGGHPLLFREDALRRGLTYHHEEHESPDFGTAPRTYSKGGPGLAVGDVDGNGLDDVFVGTDRRREAALFLQNEPGHFTEQPLPFDAQFEDMGALFFDAEGDGDLDLYVVSGGTATTGSAAYQDRLYLNDGRGVFSRAPQALPEMTASGSSVTAADYDDDGDLDLFVGGRLRPGSYPLPARSYLLRNDSETGEARFTDATEEAAPGLAEVGLVTSALWTDFDGDERIDLLLVGEWMPITFFRNEGGRLADVSSEVGLEDTEGWWNSLAAGDFDRDGDVDYVAGNLGLNTRYAASPDRPVRVHAKDFDTDGRIEPVLSHEIAGVRYPAHGRDAMIDQIAAMILRFPTYSDYADATFADVFTDRELEGAYVAEAVRFATSYLENRGDGTFKIRPLPIRAQFAPIFGMQSGDYDGDGHLDLLMVGNSYAPDVETGRADAFVGGFLKGDGTGSFSYVDAAKSGFFVAGDAKGLAEIATGDGGSLVLATQNGGRLTAFSVARSHMRAVPVQPLDRYALMTFDDGSTRKEEFFYGSTYLSQGSRVMWVPDGVEQIVIYDGNRRQTFSVHNEVARNGDEGVWR